MAQHASTGDMSVPAPRTRGWSEDWLAVVAGAAVFVLALGLLLGNNLLGWVTGPRTWLEIGKSVRPVSSAYVAQGSNTEVSRRYMCAGQGERRGGANFTPRRGWWFRRGLAE